jgi:hypothetical protein
VHSNVHTPSGVQGEWSREQRNDGTIDHSGAIAQLGERRLCKPEVAGSSPAGSMVPHHSQDLRPEESA